MDPALLQPMLTDRLDWLVDWLYPPRCRACGGRIYGRDAEYLCSGCWPKIRLVSHPLCNLCGRPFLDASGDDHCCAACLARQPYFVRARAWGCYPRDESAEHPLRQVVQKFKYGRKVSLGKPLGRLMAQGCRGILKAMSRGFDCSCSSPSEAATLARIQSVFITGTAGESLIRGTSRSLCALSRKRDGTADSACGRRKKEERSGRVRSVSREIIERARRCCWLTMFTRLVQRSMSAVAFWSEAGRQRSTVLTLARTI